MTDTTIPESPDRTGSGGLDAAEADLEQALTDIDGLAHVLSCMEESEAGSYLGERLHEHYRAAHDAFCRIFQLDDYGPARRGGDEA